MISALLERGAVGVAFVAMIVLSVLALIVLLGLVAWTGRPEWQRDEIALRERMRERQRSD